MGLIKEEQVAAGRIWLILRHIDLAGAGWVSVGNARDHLCQSDSSLRVCGWRQLRNLLNRGEGIFWRRAKGRIWLRSVAKVAHSLNVPRLTGSPVNLPVEVLLQGIGTVRAHLYASFHSGRAPRHQADLCPKPIARRTLQDLSHICRRSQRNYEKRARVRPQSNYAIGHRRTTKDYQFRAWKHGRALFLFTDHSGTLGLKEAVYSAWQLPNSYYGPHEQRPKGRQRRINRELADLFMKGMTGNGKETVKERRRDRRFYDNGFLAATGYSRSRDRDLYWRSRLSNYRRHQMWHVLPGQEES